MWWPSSSAKFLADGFRRQRTCPYDRGARLRLISYLAPSIPHALFALVARHVADRCDVETSIVHSKRCFFATGRNDAGRASRVRSVVFTLNGRSVSSGTGVVCTRLGRYSVRVAKAGAVRSRVYSGR